MNVRAPVLSLVPQRHRHQRCPGLLGKRGRAAHDPGGLAEELDLDLGLTGLPVMGADPGCLRAAKDVAARLITARFCMMCG